MISISHSERRKRARTPGLVIYLSINHESCALIDLSQVSITFEGEGFEPGDVIDVEFVSALDSNDEMVAQCRVLRVEGFRVAAMFTHPTPPLRRFIADYISQ